MISYRNAELRTEAANYRLIREAQEGSKRQPETKRRRGLFGKIIPA
jgi:hypothetical protein